MTSSNPRRILVTSALPYANSSIHLGHLFEVVQTDIWVRFQRLRGHECYYVCADDTHGTPVMLKAEELGVSPESLIHSVNKEHQRDFQEFLISFDNYYTTHSEENRIHAEHIYRQLQEAGQIAVRSVKQLFDEQKGVFLADRFIRGDCPSCGADDQYGDNCEVCGATYEATDLGNPRSTLSGARPVERTSDHHFFQLSNHADFLKDWIRSGSLQEQVANKLTEWLNVGLKDWDISRDAPYFGFEIPDAPGKFFYVWMDAPVGYLASFQQLCEREGIAFDDFWHPDSDCEVHHFIGKDIINFHALFWPAILSCTGLRTPTSIHAHGFITVNGQKMSKSRGTFIDARTYLQHLRPEYLRYYYAARMTRTVDDIDLNLDDFVQRVNSDLVGKLVNIASRCAGFLHRLNRGRLAASIIHQEPLDKLRAAADTIADCYEQKEFGKAMREIMLQADQINRYIDTNKPWEAVRQAGNEADVLNVCTVGINAFRLLLIYLKPVLPKLTADAENFLQVSPLIWQDLHSDLLDHQIGNYKPLMQRVTDKSVAAIIETSRVEVPGAAEDTAATGARPEKQTDTISIDEFARLDLRVARILAADLIEGADRLLRLTLDLGNQETRTVFAGIRAAYDPEQLQGRLTVLVANLKPRKMRFGTSEGMVLAAGPGGKDIYLLQPDSGAEPGMQVS